MNADEIIQHKRNLISIYTKNLRHIEVRQAKEGLSVSTITINEIENYRNMIARLEEEIEELTSSNASTVLHRLESIPSSLQKYDDFITRFSEEMKVWNNDPDRFEISLLHSLSRASMAKYTFVAKYIDSQWKITSDSVETCREIEELLEKNASLRELLLQSIRQNEGSLGRFLNNPETCIFTPFKEDNDYKILVFYDARYISSIDSAFFDIIYTILSLTRNMSIPQRAEQIEFGIYNHLKSKFGYVSDGMYGRQFYLFNQRLENTTMYFEPIIFLSPYAPSIFGWEALARDKETKKAPMDLFRTAELWGARFTLQLDIHFLQMATELYVIDYSDSKSMRTMRKDRISPLTVNVYPDSLIRSNYYSALKKIEKKKNMPLNKLYLEISEKTPLPLIIDNTERNLHPIESFREHLFKYNDLSVRFSIDDFGVGYASSSRLSRIGPACIKIDRDALLDIYGNFTLEYVIKLARRMLGDITVIVEGHDEESKMSLRKLYELGVRYVQSTRYGSTTPQPNNRLPLEMVNYIRKELEGVDD